MAIEGVRPRAGGVVLAVRLTPKGGRDAIDGWAVDANGKRLLKVRVNSAPENGRANAALTALLARTVEVAKRDVRIQTGETSRMKTVEIDGEPGPLMLRLGALKEAK